jgi:hypothetical protein
MTTMLPTVMSSFRTRRHAVERQSARCEREWRSQSEPALNDAFIVVNNA